MSESGSNNKPPLPVPSNSANVTYVLFNLRCESLSSSSIRLWWTSFSARELLKLYLKLVDTRLSSPTTITTTTTTTESNILNITLRVESGNANDTVDHLLLAGHPTSQQQQQLNETLLTNIRANVSLRFSLRLFYQVIADNDGRDNTRQSLHREHLFASEATTCTTWPLAKTFESSALRFVAVEYNRPPPLPCTRHLNVSFDLSERLAESYPFYELVLSKQLATTAQDDDDDDDDENAAYERVDNTSFVDARSGSRLLGPIESNQVYGVTLLACSLTLTRWPPGHATSHIFDERNCVQLGPFLYALSTRAPEQLAPLRVVTFNASSIELEWTRPRRPNDYRLTYLIYKRETCRVAERRKPFDDELCPLTGETNLEEENNEDLNANRYLKVTRTHYSVFYKISLQITHLIFVF